ncbi:MAG: hypothetical protein ACOX0A_10085 [Thermoguttaceae bacterium]
MKSLDHISSAQVDSSMKEHIMTRAMIRTNFAICMATFFFFAVALSARAQETPPQTWDPNATAESLGLEPYEIPDDLFPVFPWDHLGDWMSDYQTLDVAMESMAECEFTLSGFVNSVEMAREAEKNGLMCIYETGVDIFDARNLSDEEIAVKCAEIDERIRTVVEETKDLPNVIGYNLVDEPSCYKFKALAAAVAAVKKYAPGKLAYVNLYPGYASTIGADADSQLGAYSFEEYLERYVQEVKPQLLSYDNYMLEYSEDMRNYERAHVFFSDLFLVRSIALKYNIPFWFIGSSLCILENSSPPTPARYALQTYMPLAAGSDGATWFLYYPLGWRYSPIDRNGSKTLSWLYMRDINIQARAIGTYLKKFRSTDLGMDPFYTQEEAPNLPQFPAKPTHVLPNLVANASANGTYSDKEAPKLMVGEFAAKEGDALAALVVNMSLETSVKVTFQKPAGYSTLKVVSPIDGSEKVVSDEDFAEGFWIIPGHGTLFVLEK